MTEMFRKYGSGGSPEGRKASPTCVVAHPEAGGPCGRPAAGEVWNLPFCEVHGREAELAYRDELSESVGNKLQALADAENERHDRDEGLLTALGAAPVPSGVRGEAHEEAMAKAYPPEELIENADPDILAFDYGELGTGIPYDWWCRAREMVVGFMRRAVNEAPELLGDLELLRERATVQQLLAKRDLDRRWAATAR